MSNGGRTALLGPPPCPPLVFNVRCKKTYRAAQRTHLLAIRRTSRIGPAERHLLRPELVTICCTCMVQSGGLSIGKGDCTINTRGRLDFATFFVLQGGRRRESCSSGFLHGEVSSWWRAYGRDGRD